MPAASITINGVASSNDDLPIDTLVQLNNAGVGGEVTYLWQIVSQPEGAADALSANNIVNPTFTPKKEGTYLLRLTVNGTLVNEKIAAVRFLKTRDRSPAANEDDEAGASGWATAVQRIHSRVDALYNQEHGVIVGVCDDGLGHTRGQLVVIKGRTLIKSGLPGAEYLPKFGVFNDAAAVSRSGVLGIVEGDISGGANAAFGALERVRIAGLFPYALAGAPSVGSSVWANNGGALSVGNVPPIPLGRIAGTVVASGGGSYYMSVGPHIGGQSELATGYSRFATTYAWQHPNVPANAETSLHAAGSASIVGQTMPFFGWIIGFAIDLSAAGGDTLTPRVYKNGVLHTAFSNVVNPAVNGYYQGYAGAAALNVGQGDVVELRVLTGAAWINTTDIHARLLVQHSLNP